MYSLKSHRRGDSNENTEHIVMLKKFEKIFLLCLLTWCYDYYFLARTYFHGSKGVQAIQVLLCTYNMDYCLPRHYVKKQKIKQMIHTTNT